MQCLYGVAFFVHYLHAERPVIVAFDSRDDRDPDILHILLHGIGLDAVRKHDIFSVIVNRVTLLASDEGAEHGSQND